MKLKYKEYYNDIESVSYINYTDKGKFNYKDILTVKADEFYKKKYIKDNKNSELEDIMEYYGLDLDFIVTEISKESKNKSYQIPIMSEDILALMIKNFKNNKIKNKKEENLTLDEFINYNNKLFKLIEELPSQLKNEIKNTETYIRNKEINQLLLMLLDRLNLFFNVYISNTDINEGGDQLRRLISYLDKFLYNYATHNLELKYLEKTNKKMKPIGESNYLLETLLKESFLNGIKKNIEILNFFKTNEMDENEIKKELEEVSKLNKINKLHNYDSQNLEILYNSKKEKINIEEYIKQYKLELKKDQENILKKEKELDTFGKERKYFLNDMNNTHIIRTYLKKYKKYIIDNVFNASEEKSIKIGFDKAYKEAWIDSILYNDLFMENLFKMYPSYKKEILKHIWEERMVFFSKQLYIVLENKKIILENQNKQIKYFEYAKQYKDGLQENSNELIEIINELNEFIDGVLENMLLCEYEKDIMIMEELKSMYKLQEMKDKKSNSKRNKIKSLNKKIEKLEIDLKKAKEDNNKKQEEYLEKIKEEDKNKIKKLERELLKIKDLKNTLSLALGKMFISSLYLDRENMKKENIDLKNYLKYLDKHPENQRIKVSL